MRSLLLTTIFLVLCNATIGQTLIPCKRNGKWGYKNLKGDIVIDCKYDSVTPFLNGIGIIYLNSGLSAINESGEILFTKNNARSIQPFYNNYSTYRKYSKTYIIDKKGNEIASYSDVEVVNDHYAIIIEKDKRDIYSINQRVKLTNQKYDFVMDLNFKSNKVFITQKNNLYGFIDEQEKMIAEPKYPTFGKLKNNIPRKYHSLKPFTVVDLSNPFNVRDAPEGDYKVVKSIEDSHFIIFKDDLFGVVNKEGKVIIPCKWDMIKKYEKIFLAERWQTDVNSYHARYYDIYGNEHYICE